MKLAPQGYRVAVVGASSLLGRELLSMLEERRFPVSRLVKYEADEEEPDLPIVDLRPDSLAAVAGQDVSEQELDFAFLAARPQEGSSVPGFLRPAPNGAGRGAGVGDKAHCVVIDLAETPAGTSTRVLSVPFLEMGGLKPSVAAKTAASPSRFVVSPHPAAILISSLLLRLAPRFQLKRAVAQVFEPVSEIGPRGIEELQKQTVGLLTFQKIPRQVFGEQLAFNLLPRLGRSPGSALVDLEKRLRLELREYLEGRAPLPALRLFQVPVFYSLAVSLYVETAKLESSEAIAQALAGDPIHLRRLSQAAPSQVEATGSHGILVDTLAPDAEHPAGTWVWAVADNLRLAASNAVDIAFRIVKSPQ